MRLIDNLAAMTATGGVLCVNNNQEWPQELTPYFYHLTGNDFCRCIRKSDATGSNRHSRSPTRGP